MFCAIIKVFNSTFFFFAEHMLMLFMLSLFPALFLVSAPLVSDIQIYEIYFDKYHATLWHQYCCKINTLKSICFQVVASLVPHFRVKQALYWQVNKSNWDDSLRHFTIRPVHDEMNDKNYFLSVFAAGLLCWV